ncbi:MAG: class I SAM-dependent methyltransferase [Solirubrobacterales bacterium]
MSPPACRVCGQPATALWTTAVDVEYETTDELFYYWLCRGCDCLTIDPLPEGRLSEIYPPGYYSFADGEDALAADRSLVARAKGALDRRAFRRVTELAETEAPRVLDVGGGTGEISAALIAGIPAAQATVVDFDPESTAVAAERGLSVATCRFEEFETDERYDVVMMLNLIEHVADPMATLRHAAGLLAPGGVVWMQTPNFRSLDAHLFRRRNWAGLHCPRHWVIFSVAGLRRALPAAGLEPLRLRPTQGGAFWAASILGALRRREPGRAGRPLVRDPFFLPLAGAGALFDLATSPVRAASQVACIARAAGE